jgi:hypothetical protein
MTEHRLGDQLVRYDRDATVAAYAALHHGDAERCGCSGCRNFIAAREQAFPEAFRSFLAELGIDPNKEGEAFDYGPVEEDVYLYGGWFYFVGEVVEAGERLANTGESFQYWFSSSFARPPAVFGSAVAAVEFTTRIPWILDAPYDSAGRRQIKQAEETMARYPNTLRKLAE